LHNIALLDKIDEVVRDWNPASILYNIAEIELIEAENDRIELIVDRQSVSISTISSQHASGKGQSPDVTVTIPEMERELGGELGVCASGATLESSFEW